MINIEYKEELDEKFYKIIDAEFNKFATKNDVECIYKSFSFIAKEDDKFNNLWISSSRVLQKVWI